MRTLIIELPEHIYEWLARQDEGAERHAEGMLIGEIEGSIFNDSTLTPPHDSSDLPF